MKQLPRAYREFIFERDDHTCRYCHHRIGECCRRMAVDHIDPNGPTTLRNTVCACIRCNGSKGDRRLSDEKFSTIWWREKWVVSLNPGPHEQYLDATGAWVPLLLPARQFERQDEADIAGLNAISIGSGPIETLTLREAQLKPLRLKIPTDMPRRRVGRVPHEAGVWYGHPPCQRIAR